MISVTGGSTDVSLNFKLRLKATGLEATGLTIADLDLQYTRVGEVPTAKVDAVALAATNTAHTDNRAIELDATDQPGVYRVDWPDAAFVAGAREVILTVNHADCFSVDLRVLIDAPVNATKWRSEAIPATNQTGVPIADIVYVNGTGYSLQAFPANFDALGINASGHISRVTLVDTTTANTDMRGTDSAATAAALASLVTTVGAAGAGLTEAGGTGDHLTALIAEHDASQVLLADIPTVAEFEARTLPSASYGTADAGDAMTLTSGERDAIAAALLDLANGVETSETVRQFFRLARAALLGKSDGFPAGPAHFRDRADSKDRITATVDADGNRSAITTDAT